MSYSNDEGISLLKCLRPDRSIDILRIFGSVNYNENEYRVDESTLLGCLKPNGGLDV
jgi:hypothetical protein